jgi:phosphoglycolate phosphatase
MTLPVKNRPVKLILFDIDGTLLGSNDIHRESYTYAIRAVFDIEGHIHDIVPDGKVDSQIFLEILKVRGIPEATARPHLGELFTARYQYLVEKMCNPQPGDILPGVNAVLSLLRGRTLLGVVTGNEERSAWHRLEKAGLRDYFVVGGFGNESERRHDLVVNAVKRAEELAGGSFSPDEILLVGDTPNDVSCAKSNGLPVVGVSTGRYSLKELEESGADYLLPDLTHITEFERIVKSSHPTPFD